jgi:serine/threonine protein kinase
MLHDENMTEESLCSAEEFVEKRLDDFHDSWQQPNDDPLEIRIHTYAVEDFYFRRSIGQGSFSTVHCVFLKADGFNVASRKYEEAGQGFALKRLKENVIGDDTTLKISAADLAIEATVLSSLNHENIIKLHGVKSGNMIESLMDGSFFLVVDLLLETLDVRINKWQIKQSRSIFNSSSSKEANMFKRIRHTALGIGRGMEYLHSMNIMFR